MNRGAVPVDAPYFFLLYFVMAQANFDRRRINGPDESFRPIFDSDEEEETPWKPGSPRQGRAARDIRPICMPSSSRLSLYPTHPRLCIYLPSFESGSYKSSERICIH